MIDHRTHQIIRIAALLVVIFASGIVVGRYTAPKMSPVVIDNKSIEGPPRMRVSASLRRFRNLFDLDEEAEKQLRITLQRMEEEMRFAPPRSAERREIWRRHLPAIREQIPENQLTVYDEFVRRSESFYERVLSKDEEE